MHLSSLNRLSGDTFPFGVGHVPSTHGGSRSRENPTCGPITMIRADFVEIDQSAGPIAVCVTPQTKVLPRKHKCYPGNTIATPATILIPRQRIYYPANGITTQETHYCSVCYPANDITNRETPKITNFKHVVTRLVIWGVATKNKSPQTGRVKH